MKLTKEALVRMVRQEVNTIDEEEDLEDTINQVQDEKSEKIFKVVGPLIEEVADLVVTKFSAGAKSPDLEGVATPEEVVAIGAEALKQAITQRIKKLTK
mgnify:CR=1 FL=1